MRPWHSILDELIKKQGGDDCSALRHLTDVVDVGNLAVHRPPIGFPERQSPDRVAGRLTIFRQVARERIVVCKKNRKLRAQGYTGGSSQGCEIKD